jgi:hypothetical protein
MGYTSCNKAKIERSYKGDIVVEVFDDELNCWEIKIFKRGNLKEAVDWLHQKLSQLSM